MLVERQVVLVMFKRVPDELDAIERGMAEVEVEEAVGLRGRKYYGAFDTMATSAACACSSGAVTIRTRLDWS